MKANKTLFHLIPDIQAKKGECWENARRAVLEMTDLNILYVEGWIIAEAYKEEGFTMVEHGWIEYCGQVVEITPPWRDEQAAEYFPGINFNFPEVLSMESLCQSLLPSGQDWWLPYAWLDGRYGQTVPLYEKARIAALEFAGLELHLCARHAGEIKKRNAT